MPVRRTRNRDLRILNTIAEALNSAPDVRQALERALTLVADLLGLETGWVWLIDPGTGRYYNAAAHNLPPFLREPVRMTGKQCWCIEAFQTGRLAPKNISVLGCSRLREAALPLSMADDEDTATRGLRAHASIPLYFRDKPLGIMNVAAPAWREWSEDDLRLLSTIAYQAGIAVERARLAEEETRLARAEERTRLAREIHDTLAQSLTGIALQIEAALNELESDPPRARERLDSALALTRESLDEARRSVSNLRAALLDGKPLTDALAALARRFTSETGIRVSFRAAGDTRLTAVQEAELYRIAQEALSNIRRHAAGATEITVSLKADAGTLRLTVTDNGPGFAVAAAASTGGGHGIPGMRERARTLGGSLRIASRAGQGTRVVASIPAVGSADGSDSGSDSGSGAT